MVAPATKSLIFERFKNTFRNDADYLESKAKAQMDGAESSDSLRSHTRHAVRAAKLYSKASDRVTSIEKKDQLLSHAIEVYKGLADRYKEEAKYNSRAEKLEKSKGMPTRKIPVGVDRLRLHKPLSRGLQLITGGVIIHNIEQAALRNPNFPVEYTAIATSVAAAIFTFASFHHRTVRRELNAALMGAKRPEWPPPSS